MSLIQFLSHSRAGDAFREAVAVFCNERTSNALISFNAGSPAVKVERTLTKLLKSHPELEIDSIEINAVAGCEYYRGHLRIRTPAEERLIHFDWDCKWKAEQEGWIDYFGFPDQIRAAREFGYDCFRSWSEVSPAT